jgi:thiosulfate reductase cytochrome b subunit
MTATTDGRSAPRPKGPLVYRQSAWTRVTHWIWAASVFFLLTSGLQIFNAHPALYLGEESGFEYDNAVLALAAEGTAEGLRGTTTILGYAMDTTGLLGASGGAARGFPAWATLPSYQDLATGRLVHLFAAWILVATLAVWAVASVVNGHIRRDLLPTAADLRDVATTGTPESDSPSVEVDLPESQRLTAICSMHTLCTTHAQRVC